MYATLLQVAHDIVVIGGALMIILGIILLIMLIVAAARINNLVSKGMHTISMISEYIMLPFTYLAGMFSRSADKPESTARKRSPARKK